MKKLISLSIFFVLLLSFFLAKGCKSAETTATQPPVYDTVHTNAGLRGASLTLIVEKGSAFNYPLMAIWIEDPDSVYLQTLYVPESIATSIFRHGQADKGKWMPGEIRRPAALPYWGHSRGIKAGDGLYIPSADSPMPDAVTGATPTTAFVLKTQLKSEIGSVFTLYFEINQSWDWNEYWTNNKFPGNEAYATSSQPAIVYAVQIDLESPVSDYSLKPIGHSHPTGENGRLFTDLSTLSTALDIVEQISVSVN